MAPSSAYSPVLPLLRKYGSAAYAAMLEFLPSADPKTDVQKYLYGPLGEYPRRQGKLIRASLCMATCCAFAGRPADALNTAVAIELLHSATLVHDDFADGAPTRRRDIALHRRYGSELGINAGDALLLLSARPLLKNFEIMDKALAARLQAEFDWAAWQTAEGQASELGWRFYNRLDTTVADYFTMAMKKTAWLGMIFPLRAGALIATGGSIDLDRIFGFGYYLGCLFQIANDIKNLVDPQHKDHSDIVEGKRSLILIHAINSGNLHEKDKVRSILGKSRGTLTPEDVAWLENLIEERGSIQFARSCAEAMAEVADGQFRVAFGDLAESPEREFLRNLIGYFSSLAEER
jgi:geranylgeranyl diphosphate synthase, type II